MTQFEISSRPKRACLDSQRSFLGCSHMEKTLELSDLIKVLKEYPNYDGGINCSICGKLYKSRVCFIKHLWEHSVYWDQFEGAKNHERVLSIQAALILYTGYHGDTTEVDDGKTLSSLLVTSPHQEIKRKERDINGNILRCSSPLKSPSKQRSPSKRKSSGSFCRAN